MKLLVVAATLAAGLFLANSSPALSADRAEELGFLTRAQTRAYHACLFEAWIQNYCRVTSWGYSHVYSECVIANGGGIYPFEFRFLTRTEDYCWNSAQSLPPR